MYYASIFQMITNHVLYDFFTNNETDRSKKNEQKKVTSKKMSKGPLSGHLEAEKEWDMYNNYYNPMRISKEY